MQFTFRRVCGVQHDCIDFCLSVFVASHHCNAYAQSDESCHVTYRPLLNKQFEAYLNRVNIKQLGMLFVLGHLDSFLSLQ